MKAIERVAFALGLLLLVWLFRRIGAGPVLHALSRVGWGFSGILALYGMNALLNTLAWRATLPREARIPLKTLFAFLLAGDAINALTPSAVVGGELVRVSLLSRKVPGVTAAASVALAAAMQFLGQVAFVLIGTPLLLARIGDAPFRKGLLALFGGILLIFAIAAFLARRRDLFQRLHRGLVRFGFYRARSSSQEARWRSLDESIFGAMRDRPGDLGVALVLFSVGWAMGGAEIYLVLLLLGSPLGWVSCFVIELLSVIIDAVLFFVPARVGTQEGGKYVIFGLLGLDPGLGFVVGLLRRMREMAWALIGLAVLGYWQSRPLPARLSGLSAAAVASRPGGREFLKPEP